MLIVELIGSLSFIIVLLSTLVLAIIYIKTKRNHFDHSIREDTEQVNAEKPLPIINVIENEEISSSSPRKYGIQWTKLSNDESQPNEILQTFEFEQGDSLSLDAQSISVRYLIEKFENHLTEKLHGKEKTERDLTSLDTNFDTQTIKTDWHPDEPKLFHHSSISNLDITVPSNLSSSIDLEQFECTSSTSNLSEFLRN